MRFYLAADERPAGRGTTPRLALRGEAGSGARLSIRSDLPGFKVAEARRMLMGLPKPGDYRVVIKPLRYPTRPHLSGLCQFDLGRIIVRLPDFALRNFRRRQVTVEDALEALRGCRTQPLPEHYWLAP